MIHSRLYLFLSLTVLTFGVAACQGSGSGADSGSSVSLATPTLPTEVKDVKKWTYDLYCSAQNSGEQIRATAQLIGTSTTAKDGAVTFTGDKVATVQKGWFCLMDMTTDEAVSGAKDAKPALASNTRKVFFSSVATQVPTDRKLKLELTRKYAAANAAQDTSTATGTGTTTGQNPGTGTGTGTGTSAGTSTSTTIATAPGVAGQGGTTSSSTNAGTGAAAGTAGQTTLKITSQGATTCPAGKRFNTDPSVMACQ